MPIKVESDIQKCESMGSIFDFLSRGNDANHSALTQSQQPSAGVQLEMPQNGQYVLQLPPFKARHPAYVSGKESLESSPLSSSGISSSGIISPATSMSTLPQMEDSLSLVTAKKNYSSENILSTGTTFEQGCGGDQSTTNVLDVAHSQQGGYIQEPQIGDHKSNNGSGESCRVSPLQGSNVHGHLMCVKSDKDLSDVQLFVEENGKVENNNISEESNANYDKTKREEGPLDEGTDSLVVFTFMPSSNSALLHHEPNPSHTVADHHTTLTRTNYADESLTSLNLVINPQHFNPPEPSHVHISPFKMYT